ncbi:ubiquinone biosynthesis O-methyltransferase, mitochondrial-like isoform X2 [Ostrea edulis]|uniref:ubiquinone biosynthesis O-methyltransferase, mitochondrial-like n=1 Tax=Ostrea edulis TaxID=37623 RepID=UPI0020960E97|nr:ubiquinone biosynthesis O-methyltransferase, mitochondrial-like [Ostrea edulis]XP_048769655.1 ubiquinone biosynthesis O-methyltransferase, mitochondrial-like isoform X2 [Ostrea edulis]
MFCKRCTRFMSISRLGRNSKRWHSDHSRPIAQTTIDEEEHEKFKKLSHTWWNEIGEFQALHALNALRVPWIRDSLIEKQDQPSPLHTKPLMGVQILDAGSGGGILSEPLARLGANVIGVDMVEDNIKVAQTHLEEDPGIRGSVKYIQATVEDLVGTNEEAFDAVVASEVVEHVLNIDTFLTSCCKIIKPGGSIFLTTINKTALSYSAGVIAAEYLLRLVPIGTHDWEKFISPEDLQFMLDKSGFSTTLIHGMMYNPLTKRWSWISNTSINYGLHAVKLHSHDKSVSEDTTSEEKSTETTEKPA